jgi:mxaJ protein
MGPPARANAEEPNPASFRVCADPNNLPFSSSDRSGFENKLADIVAADLGKDVSYTWRPQRRAFIRNTLNADQCDAIMGVPAKLDLVTTSQPYYRSTYVFVYRSDHGLDRLNSILDPRLRKLAIGVQLIGDDGYNTPPSHALSEQGIVTNLVGYTVYGDYRQPDPPSRIVDAVENGTVDIAAVWGPLAGYFARRSPVGLTLTPISDTEQFKPLLFDYDISIGVRKGNTVLKTQIDDALTRHRSEITRLLEQYGVPLVNGAEGHDGSVN